MYSWAQKNIRKQLFRKTEYSFLEYFHSKNMENLMAMRFRFLQMAHTIIFETLDMYDIKYFTFFTLKNLVMNRPFRNFIFWVFPNFFNWLNFYFYLKNKWSVLCITIAAQDLWGKENEQSNRVRIVERLEAKQFKIKS